MNAKELFLSLIRARVCGGQPQGDCRDACDFKLFKEAFLIGQKQDLGHLVYDAAQTLGVLPEARTDEEKAFLARAEKLRLYAMARCVNLESEAARIDGVMRDAGIDHVFLKGAVLRALYPEPWLRTSSDIDMLVRRGDLDAAIGALTAVGYERKSDVQYHDVYLDYGKVRLELHHNILENIGSLNKVLERVWENVEEDEGSRKRMTRAYFVFHQVAHAAYHFMNGGCGFRPFIDLWLLERQGYDREKVEAFCRDAGIDGFYRQMRKISEYAFGGGELDDDAQDVLDYVLGFGEYAGKENARAMTAGNSGRVKRVLRYIFIPYKDLTVIYPGAKNKLLVPFYQARRWFDRLFVQKKWDKAVKRVKNTKNYDDATVAKMEALRKKAGLESMK